ncbi:MAG: saccharopine dehydrogenase [Bacteroidales bacterium]|nr:saccharopine dehydrogenase [Bacteroidales bacterium]
MKILALGGAGKITREAVLDLSTYGDFEKITIADINLREAESVASSIGRQNIDAVRLNVFDKQSAIAVMKNYDLVLDGTAISLNKTTTECIALAGCHGINLNGFGDEYQFHSIFESNGRIMVPGFGMTPGVTNMMAVHAADKMELVNTVRVSHGAFRPIAFSGAIVETTVYEYDPNLSNRVVFEEGRFIQVPPFSRPLEIDLPMPYGRMVQYIIPHSETVTLEQYLRNKGVSLIEVRGTWPLPNMNLLRTLYDWGFLKNEKILVNDSEIGIMEAIAKYLTQTSAGRETELYGYALHVEVTGMKNGRLVSHTLTHTHPASDGSVPGWEKLRAYTRNVGIPFAIAAHLISQGKYKGTGVIIPEMVFNPGDVFNELRRREIFIHQTESDLN